MVIFGTQFSNTYPSFHSNRDAFTALCYRNRKSELGHRDAFGNSISWCDRYRECWGERVIFFCNFIDRYNTLHSNRDTFTVLCYRNRKSERGDRDAFGNCISWSESN